MNEATSFLQQHFDFPWLFDFFSDVAGPVGWWVALQFVFILAGTKVGLRLAWVVALAAISNTLFKALWAQPRPYWVSDEVFALRATGGFGMPSGHAQGAMSFWLGVWCLFRGRTLFWVACVFVVATCASRLYYGVHSLEQVLVGCALGAGLTLGLLAILPRIEPRLRETSALGQIFLGLSLVGLCLGLLWLAYDLRESFVVPQDWLTRFAATQQRLGVSGEMQLAAPGVMVLAAALAGHLALAMLCAHRGHLKLQGLQQRAAAVALAIVINYLAILLVRWLGSSVWVLSGWLAVQPLLAVWMPMKIFSRDDD